MIFNFMISRDPETVLDQVCMLAKDRVVVSGNAKEGNFSGVFDGNYTVEGENAFVEITKKPMFISWGLVEKGLNYLSV